jgi:hypothetical protein
MRERKITQRVVVDRLLTQQKKSCPVCGKTFWGAKIRQYDRLACAQKASYDRHAEERRKTRMEKYYAARKAAAKKK